MGKGQDGHRARRALCKHRYSNQWIGNFSILYKLSTIYTLYVVYKVLMMSSYPVTRLVTVENRFGTSGGTKEYSF